MAENNITDVGHRHRTRVGEIGEIDGVEREVNTNNLAQANSGEQACNENLEDSYEN